ncbi:MAG: hypothetical protein N2327_01095 [Caldimicrobium sp.]|nr:hypothetical protein [Caldimicrobium sp.]MCX7873016.1 hypothetical protein [Caldimicrobium sp.]MDW8093529.1 hypothetical protein [Caldimicrobium sp.]
MTNSFVFENEVCRKLPQVLSRYNIIVTEWFIGAEPEDEENKLFWRKTNRMGGKCI